MMMRTIRHLAVFLFTAILAVASMNSMAQNPQALPLVLSASSSSLTGFVRIINNSPRSGSVRITAIDNRGSRSSPVVLSLDAQETVNFNSRDLERGNASKGLLTGTGGGTGDWRLILDTDLDITPLAYIRTNDGFVTSMHDIAPEIREGSRQYRIVFFNPGANRRQVSLLRFANPGTTNANIVITGRDDANEPSGTVRFTLAPGYGGYLTAQSLESGSNSFSGRLGSGTGKWRLTVSSNVDIQVMSLLRSPTGHISNLSTAPRTTYLYNDPLYEPYEVLSVPLVLPASDNNLTGFVRFIHRPDSNYVGDVAIWEVTGIDDNGTPFPPRSVGGQEMIFGVGEAVNLNSRDLEQGNVSKGLLYGGLGNGEGNWRLEIPTADDDAALAYIRTSDGFVTTMHDIAPETPPARGGIPCLSSTQVPIVAK